MLIEHKFFREYDPVSGLSVLYDAAGVRVGETYDFDRLFGEAARKSKAIGVNFCRLLGSAGEFICLEGATGNPYIGTAAEELHAFYSQQHLINFLEAYPALFAGKIGTLENDAVAVGDAHEIVFVDVKPIEPALRAL